MHSPVTAMIAGLVVCGLTVWGALYLWQAWTFFALLLCAFLLSGGFLIFPKGKPLSLLTHGIVIGFYAGAVSGTAYWVYVTFG